MFVRKYFEVFLVKLILALKTLKEYRLNAYLMIITHLSEFLIFFLYFSIFSNLFLDSFLINWNLNDFLLFSILNQFGIILSRFISIWKANSLIFLSGNFNTLLVKPMSPYFFLSLTGITGGRIIGILFIFIITLFLIIKGIYSNYIYSILIFIFGIIYSILLYNVIVLLVFFIYKVKIILDLLRNFIKLNKQFTPIFFINSWFGYFFILIPNSIYAFFVVEFLKGNFNIFFKFFPSIFLSFFILILLNFFLWRKGIKRYEAFG